MRSELSSPLRSTIPAVDARAVSVVIPAYNAAVYLGDALAGVAAQTARPGEVIVVDDGSTDGTASIARRWGARVISLANGGPSAARNAGVREAHGELIAFLDADDVWAPDKLAVQLAALARYGGPAFSFTDYQLVDPSGVSRETSELRRHWAFRRAVGRRAHLSELLIVAGEERPILADSYIPPSSVLVRRADVVAIGGFEESLRVTEDFEFYLRLFARIPALAVMRPLLWYRRHPQQASADVPRMKAALFDLARLVEASPDRYPAADARYVAGTEFLRCYRTAIEEARRGRFGTAAQYLERSLAQRWTPGAALALGGARLCSTPPGQRAFHTVRGAWRRRPARR